VSLSGVSILQRILILGSAPNAVVPSADVVYCANAAAFYYAEDIKTIPTIISVVGEHLIAGVNTSKASFELKQVREALLQAKMHEMIILEHEAWFNGWNVNQGLNDVEYAGSITPTIMTFSKRAALLKATAGLEEPIFSYTLLTEAAKMSPWRFLRSSKYLLRDLRKKGAEKPIETNPVLRPSTGMWAAIAATDRYGTNAQYLISGIGLTTGANRSIHKSGKSQGKFEKFTHHLHADMRVFNKLKNIYDIEYIG
jgi:hypothetical protein